MTWIGSATSNAIRAMAPSFLLAFSLLGNSPGSTAQPKDSEAPTGRSYLLVSAVGDRWSFVVRRKSVGSRMEPFVRREKPTGDHELNKLVLKGLNDALTKREPTSKRTLLSVNPTELSQAPADRREQAALDAALDAIRQLPNRESMDEVVIVTPAMSLSQEDAMAPRLHGAGVYVQPVLSDSLGRFYDPDGKGGGNFALGDPLQMGNPGAVSAGYRVTTPAGKEHSSWQYLGIYFHARIYRYDGRTLQLISKVSRFDSIKYNDPDVGDLNYLNRIPAAFVAKDLSAMVTETARDATLEAMGRVVPGILRTVPVE